MQIPGNDDLLERLADGCFRPVVDGSLALGKFVHHLQRVLPTASDLVWIWLGIEVNLRSRFQIRQPSVVHFDTCRIGLVSRFIKQLLRWQNAVNIIVSNVGRIVITALVVGIFVEVHVLLCTASSSSNHGEWSTSIGSKIAPGATGADTCSSSRSRSRAGWITISSRRIVPTVSVADTSSIRSREGKPNRSSSIAPGVSVADIASSSSTATSVSPGSVSGDRRSNFTATIISIIITTRSTAISVPIF